MAERKPRLYWDSNVWAEWSRNQLGHRDLCAELLLQAEAGNLEIVVSPLVVAEFAPLDRSIDDILSRYLRRSSFIRTAFTWRMAEEARELVRSHSGMSGPDAAHLACAIHAKADVFHTYDGNPKRGLLHFASDITRIRICAPEWPGQTRLLLGPEEPR